MNKPSRFLITLGLAVGIASASWAEVVAPVVVPQPGGNGVKPIVLTGTPGDFKFESIEYPKGLLQSQYLQNVFNKNEADRNYFLSTVNAIQSEFRDVILSTIYKQGTIVPGSGGVGIAVKIQDPGGLLWMSGQGRAGFWFGPADFMNAINRYQEARLGLESKIASLTAIADGALPSQVKLEAEGSGLKDVPNYGQINFEPLKKFYSDKLLELTVQVSNLEQHVIMVNGQKTIIDANTGKSLELPDGDLKLNDAEMAQLVEDIENAHRWANPDDRDKVDGYTIKIRTLVMAFIDNYGTTERFRPENPDMQAAWAEMTEAFWTRSYLRAIYRMPLGAIAVTFNKQWFELEKYLRRTKDLLVFQKDILWGDTQFMRQESNYRNALKISESRARKLGISDLKADASKILDGDLSFLETGRNLMTYLSGNRNLAETIRMMVKLLAADLYEERLIQKATGPALMLARYQARYLPPIATGKPDPADVAKIKALQDAYDPPKLANMANSSDDTLNGQFKKVRGLVRLKLIQWRKAELAQATMDIANKSDVYANEIERLRNQALGIDAGK